MASASGPAEPQPPTAGAAPVCSLSANSPICAGREKEAGNGDPAASAFPPERLDPFQAEEVTWTLDTIPAAIFVKDARSRFLYANRVLEELWGISFSRLRGKDGSEIFPPEQMRWFLAKDREVFAGRSAVEYVEPVWNAKLRADRIARTIKRPIYDEHGTSLYLVCLMLDITDQTRAEEELQQSERRLKESQRIAKLGSWELDLVGNRLVWSDEIFRIFEIDKDKFEASYEAFLAAVHPEDRAMVNEAYTAHIVDHRPYEITHRLRLRDGRIKYVTERCQSDFSSAGKALRSIGTVQDVTAERIAAESLELASLIYRSSKEGVMVTDENNAIIDVNPAFTEQTGYTIDEVRGRNPRVLRSGRHDRAFYDEMWHAIRRDGHWQGELWDRRKDGSLHVKLATIRVLRHEDGRIYRHVAQFFDITDRKQKEELIWKQANFDTLTALPNRRLLLDRLEQEIKKASRAERAVGLLFLDLDRFKTVNDTLGHAKGDALLVEASHRIRACVRGSDTVARLGGDEFTIILTEFGDPAHVERIVQDILRTLSQPYDLGDGDTSHISASVGIALYPNDAQDRDELMRHADQAMYAAKAAGRNRYRYFTPSMQADAWEKIQLTNDLRKALAAGELDVHFQPILDLADGRLVKAEALLRWNHPRRGPVPAATFVPLAEESGLILQLGDWVVRQTIATIDRWHRTKGRIVQVSINVSPVQFELGADGHWPALLRASGLPPQSIAVEITESVLVKDFDNVRERLLRLHRNGIDVSVDDFGTGFSALSYLKHFDIDYLKIDRSFVGPLPEGERDRALVEAIILMARKLGIRTIAEGVESEAQRDLLRAVGCDYMQGYLFSPALPAAEFETLL